MLRAVCRRPFVPFVPPEPSLPISRVLLVDDEPDIRRIGELALRRVGGMEVISVASGLEALERVAEVKPDVLLLDVMMPGIDGPTTLERLRARPDTQTLPVVFMTAKTLRPEIERWMALGAVGVIFKPFDPMALPAELRRIVEERPPPPKPPGGG